MSQRQRLMRRQLIALVVFIIWAVLLALGLFGQDVAIPRAVTVPAGTIAIIALAFLIPVSALYGLLRDRPMGKSTSRQVWMAWRWRFAIGGACAGVVASVLLLPATRVAFQVRIGGFVGLIWAMLCIWVAALAFQAKLELQAPKGSSAAVLWWSAHGIRVLLATIAITAAWLLVLVLFANAHG
jgi:hypothetical protein